MRSHFSGTRRIVRSLCLLATLLLFVVIAVHFKPEIASAQGSPVVAFEGARVIPGDGSQPIENATFIVQDEKIVQLGPKDSVKAPKNAMHVDLTGKTVMPLIEEDHVHIGYMQFGPTDPNVKDGYGRLGGHISKANYSRESILDELRRYRYYGIGAVMVLGTDRNNLELQIRDEQRSGKLNDPTLATLFTADDGIVAYNNGEVNGGPPFATDVVHEAPTPEAAREAVRMEAAKKPDIIKFWVDDRNHAKPLMQPEIYKAIIDEAHKQHLRVIAHIYTLDDARGVVDAGVDALAHPPRDKVIDDALLQKMKANNVFQCSTLGAGAPRNWFDDPELAETVPQATIDSVKPRPQAQRAGAPNAPPRDPNAFSPLYITTLKTEKLESDAGIRVTLCGDSGSVEGWFPGYIDQREIWALADTGIPKLQVLRDVTQVSGDILGLQDRDTLAKGKRADFVVLNANPLDDIRNTRKIVDVYVDGKPIDRAAMRQHWTGTKE